MGVHPKIKGPVYSLRLAVFADRLADRQDMFFLKGGIQRSAAVTGGPKRNLLARLSHVRVILIKGVY